MKEIYKNWDFEHFLTFMMYHAAQADFYFAQEEKELIMERVGLDEFYELRDFHKQNSDYENIQVILYFKEKFCLDKDYLDRVFETVYRMFNVDGKYSYYEKNMMHGLKMPLENF